jgi:hypothetical protein
MITLSSYTSDDEKRKATVFRDQNDGKYYVSMTNEFGTSFRADFLSEEGAEIFAEDWVLKNE